MADPGRQSVFSNNQKISSVQFLTFDDENQIIYNGYCKLKGNTLSKYLHIDPLNKEIKPKSTPFNSKFVKEKHILCIIPKNKFRNLVLIFQNEKLCEKFLDRINKFRDSSNDLPNREKIIQDHLFIPFFHRLCNSHIVKILNDLFKHYNQQEKQNFIAFLKDCGFYDTVTSVLPTHNSGILVNTRKRRHCDIKKYASVEEPVPSKRLAVEESAEIDEPIEVGDRKLKYIASLISSVQTASDKKLQKIEKQIRHLKERQAELKSSTKAKLDNLTVVFQAVRGSVVNCCGTIIESIDKNSTLQTETADYLKKVVTEKLKPVRKPNERTLREQPFPAAERLIIVPMAYAAREEFDKKYNPATTYANEMYLKMIWDANQLQLSCFYNEPTIDQKYQRFINYWKQSTNRNFISREVKKLREAASMPKEEEYDSDGILFGSEDN